MPTAPFLTPVFTSAVAENLANKGSGGLYLNPSSVPDGGSVRFSILGDSSLSGYEIWGRTSEGKPRSIRFESAPTSKELADRAADEGITLIDKQGNPTKPKLFLAFWAWSYSESSVQLFQATQTTILEAINRLLSDEDVSTDLAAWDMELSRTGVGLETRYSLDLKPGKRKGAVKVEVDAAWEEAMSKGYNLSALLSGGDPFHSPF